MNEIRHEAIQSLPVSHKAEHEGYEYFRRRFVPFGAAKNTLVSVYEIPPGKAAYPYHFHHNNEETFYIISGEGVLKTPAGEKMVRAGEMLFFPTGPEGAHKLTNASETENLVYIDFDAVHDVDITIYPDSEKIGVWGMGVNKVFPKTSDVDYYDGE
ncbi:MAG: cupin domain-containing protein [Clostridia bacterium]|nr:cupin domain-containing protein [Clostridia bacterium]